MSKYIKNNGNSKVVAAVFGALLLVLVIAWVLLENAAAEERNRIKPDRVFPMANAHIGWEQSWHRGAWNE